MNDRHSLHAAYAAGERVAAVAARTLTAANTSDAAIWIARVAAETLHERASILDAVPQERRAALPLYGLPFAVKDNIDVAGMPTTAACPAFAYTPERSATAVERLEAAGALLVGKTNLDQFATGLVGTRSPYGVPSNPFDARYIPGGSSSGSATAVARGLVSFALGTDTAGSGRVPAGFNGIVGLKPTFGVLSAAGVVPACRSLDCVSIFAPTVDDAEAVFATLAAPDTRDAYSRTSTFESAPIGERFAFAVPARPGRTFCGDDEAEASFDRALARIEQHGGESVAFDFTPFAEAARLLYEDAFVAERTAAVGDFADAHPDALLDVTRAIVAGGRRFSAVDAFRAQYRLRDLRRASDALFRSVPVMVVPTSPTIYTLAQIAAEPYRANATLGTYTNFVNFFDLCAIAIPSDRYSSGVPIGITLIGPAFADRQLAALARRLVSAAG